MPEIIAEKTIFTLAEVARSIQKTLQDRYRSVYWIKAEMNKLNHYSHSGHCYPELLEKKDGKVIAEIRSTLWKGDYQRINQHFLELTKEPLKNGIRVLLQASITYDPIHGLSLHIVDIDPSFSLGELEREKQLSIETLKSHGIFDNNKQLSFPLLPKRIAIISVETSKGYADFLKIIDGNPYGYYFEHQLFPALLQGDKSVSSIIKQLKEVAKHADHFDVVAIIRGGGGEIGLSSYNHLDLATAIATFPIPVITGIGHATNETVSEMVAYKNAITPSELADYLMQHFHRFAQPITNAEKVLQLKTKQLLREKNEALESTIKYFRISTLNIVKHHKQQTSSLLIYLLQHSKYRLAHVRSTFRQNENQLLVQTKHVIINGQSNIGHLAQRLKRENVHLGKHFKNNLLQLKDRLTAQVELTSTENQSVLKDAEHRLSLQSKSYLQLKQKDIGSWERHLSLLDPHQVLKRGYSITLKAGKAITDASTVNMGNQIKTIFAFGEVQSEVTFVKASKKTDTHE
ncbi:exodeoxyribonuclease VII large subunit [Olivibacter sp. SDN3]|uniref:exodeoxyribonuclease VII large subunit n=1 Tax=Olivibacter sp. SDN3 TaxID=2764720 RepID=UPI0016514261|nr:exodeoxyribonuclease VII large subunit [Olivibacter sp. SDN3]QNL51259.1 exodeoxyribonuclease VII large subunit [Olivibacter sp. SDN3]